MVHRPAAGAAPGSRRAPAAVSGLGVSQGLGGSMELGGSMGVGAHTAERAVEAGVPVPCWHAFGGEGGMLSAPLPGLDDPEGQVVPRSLGPVCDAHVHVFPDKVFTALWRWFEQYGWPVRYQLHAHELLQFLHARGVRRVVALHYAHKPGLARSMNAFMAEVVAQHPFAIGTATVFPGEPDAEAILRDAFALGLRGVKMHCHVQCMAPDDRERMHDVYRTCQELGQPLVIHAGREPKSPAYHCDPHALCGAERIERVLRAYPRLKLCVPHLGADEFEAYGWLLTRYDNLWLDTTMTLAAYLPGGDEAIRPLLQVRPERLMYGSDFPNLPYAWDRELKRLSGYGLGDEATEQLLWRNAVSLFELADA